jgi:hypothetical protein
MRSWMRWLGLVCLSLLLWTVAAESTHNHASQTDSTSCTICLAAHTASPAPASADTTPVFATVGVAQEETVLAQARLDFSDLGNRGPPIL